jgi:hypothetical protein
LVLDTTIRCGISTIPAFINCSETTEPELDAEDDGVGDVGVRLANAHRLDQHAVEQRASRPWRRESDDLAVAVDLAITAIAVGLQEG